MVLVKTLYDDDDRENVINIILYVFWHKIITVPIKYGIKSYIYRSHTLQRCAFKRTPVRQTIEKIPFWNFEKLSIRQ